ncbi:MAG: biotin--[acetyl-CoA-carboxylase] ligase [Candidatus Cloacimonetes bacterium]|nr:biotin--[acetyl-CoA-carboxylase] ligase [Candidatus Cloacimonadota bacterium]
MRKYYYYDELDSTMSEYLRLKESIDSPIVVRAATQKDGIGRANHIWLSPPGGLWFTFDLYLEHSVPSFALYVGFCIHECLLSLFVNLQNKLKIKWTNDIIYDDHKLGGILCRYVPAKKTYTIGIGLNTNNAIDKNLGKFGAVSLKDIIGFDVSNRYLCQSLIESIESKDKNLSSDLSYLTYCNENLFGKGRWARIELGGLTIEAEVIGIDINGALIIRKDMGEYISIHTGTILDFISKHRVLLDR